MLKHDLRTYARSIGVDHLGIGSVEEFTDTEALLTRQKASGTYPGFTERDIPSRTRPAKLLPDAKSIISVAVSYLTDDDGHPKMGDTPRGLVSRYAWGSDYHPILREKLEQIITFLQSRVDYDITYKAYVDTGPPVDRAFASRAGIGWFGKNACMYVPGHGSWVFLAQIITNVDLPPDPPINKSCGTCDKCIRACPTGAIERPFWVNPEKCLSYITQMPGMIPKQFRKPMGRHLFGCDICQIVCPWNWEAVPGGDDAFKPREAPGARPDLIKLLTVTNSEFRRLFGPTAMGWRGKKILQRNACICLGNIGDPAAVPALAAALRDDPKPVVRASAAWALGQIGGPDARHGLNKALEREKDAMVIEEIHDALGELKARPRIHDEHHGKPTEKIVRFDSLPDERGISPSDDRIGDGKSRSSLDIHD